MIYAIYYIILLPLCQYHTWLEVPPLSYSDNKMYGYVMAFLFKQSIS